MRRTSVHAVENVHIEAPFGLEDELRWFYEQVGRLEFLDSKTSNPGQLCFLSGRLALLVRLLENPRIEPIARQATLLVPSLDEVVERLEERKVRFERMTGTVWTDQRIGTNDPAGNRVELKQEWPDAPL